MTSFVTAGKTTIMSVLRIAQSERRGTEDRIPPQITEDTPDDVHVSRIT